MFDEVFRFLRRHSSLVITTHDNPDADGIGAEIAFAQICREMGIRCRVLNAGGLPARFSFMDPQREIGLWSSDRDCVNPENSALLILDSSDEFNIGGIRNFIPLASEVFIIDHHDHAPKSGFGNCIDSSASSTCELTAELAGAAGITLNPVSAAALYAGISYDTGSFAFPKTTARTFRVAQGLTENGAAPYTIHHELNESAGVSALLLQQRVFSTLEILNNNRLAVQILRRQDLEKTNARIEDAEAFINIPFKAKDIIVSVLIKENHEGQVRCSLRSKGEINVSKIAQSFGGGGHITASGFRSAEGVDKTLAKVLEKINLELEKDRCQENL